MTEPVRNQQGRWYQAPDGTWVPSVTTIIGVIDKGEGFARWLGNHASYETAEEQRTVAADTGLLVHQRIHDALGDYGIVDLADIGVRPHKLLMGFVRWWEEAAPVLLHSEVVLFGEGYAGTCDLICEIGEIGLRDTWIIDYKTSGAIYNTVHLQTAAYAAAFHREAFSDSLITRRGALHLKTNTKKGWQLVESPFSMERDYADFLHAKALWHREHGEYEPQAEVEPVSAVQLRGLTHEVVVVDGQEADTVEVDDG